MIIGITGGIGGGKSTVSELFRQMGFHVYDTDLAGRHLQNNDVEVRQKIISLLGNDSYNGNTLNRAFVASQVFQDNAKLSALNAIVHPAVKADFQKWVETHSQFSLLFMECAVLFEANFESIVDKILLVTAPVEVRVARVMKRDGLSEKQVQDRIKHQIPDSEKIKRADFIINTDSDQSLEEQMKLMLNTLRNS